MTITGGYIPPMSIPPITTVAGTMYVGSSAMLYALRERDGKQLWSVPADIPDKPIIANNVLYTLSGHKTVALNASTGVLIWQSSNGFYELLLNPNRGAIYAYGLDAKTQQRALLALKLSDGSVLWTSPHASGLLRLMSNNEVYLAASSGNCNQPNASDVYAVQASDGRDLWHVHL
ncbi:MAG: hypothetical protein NVSMB49_28730 [Ktedonobacteraceae bacterium]